MTNGTKPSNRQGIVRQVVLTPEQDRRVREIAEEQTTSRSYVIRTAIREYLNRLAAEGRAA